MQMEIIFPFVDDNCPSVYNPGPRKILPPGGNECGDACDCEGNFDCDEDCDGTDAAVIQSRLW